MTTVRRSRADPAEGLEKVAGTVHRLAVLLAAGVAPHSAWRHVASASEVARLIVRGVDRGDGVVESMLAATADGAQDASAWRAVSAAWLVASTAGAPLAPALRAFAGALRGLAQTRRDAAVALAGPAATTRIVLLLPVVGLLFGALLGFDTLGVLLGTAPGFACLALGAALAVVARRWNRRLLARATPTDDSPGLRLDLVAIAVSGGASLEAALERVEAALSVCGVSATGAETVGEVLDLSQRAGVPAAELLRAEAEEVRRRERSRAQQSSARLGVSLMLPLGVCILPAFLLVGVVPLVIAVISSTVTAL